MFDQITHGPVEILPPSEAPEAELIISGISPAVRTGTTYVILDEVHGTEMKDPVQHDRYAGSFNISNQTGNRIHLDITAAFNKALLIRPNFHISFLTERTGEEQSEPTPFSFRELEITHRHPINYNYGLSADVVHH